MNNISVERISLFIYSLAQQVRRRPLSTRLGDVGQGGARNFAQAIKRSPVKQSLAGRVGKRASQSSVA